MPTNGEDHRPLYLLRLDNDLRAFIPVPEHGEPEVVDIVMRERLEQFAKAAR